MENIFIKNLINELETSGIEKNYSKGDLILKAGEIERNLYFITSGAVRIFLLSENEEHCIRFGFEGAIINSLSSYFREDASEFYIEAMRKTTLKVISKEKINEIISNDAESLLGYARLLETVIAQQLDREVDLLTFSPSERLKRVLERSPDLFQQIPLKYIASYLRMTPETLSRIMNS
ncbi:Crp/Fnr family transcriptional regulator [Chryseobacterium oryctis]|uniref:Crp/Fnr family transcriptional regulator n=1 Tax=Chryseobacterium oryctis TaxID=2952618 RepID=A0ABT3HSI6_9FLAO|nr:Crp/Fnr family transcriptional regulator [Chryseobacterium oryctis]MCW3162744.1 Crp/Fnr family transcriptional regulator [Chryseobacterium oryctis]